MNLDMYAAHLAGRLNRLLDTLDQLEPDRLANWRDLAACRNSYDPVFFPDKGRPRISSKAAARWCDGCPVKTECGEYAIRNDVREGIWGGMSYHERRRT